MFSAMSNLKNKYRHKLDELHLNVVHPVAPRGALLSSAVVQLQELPYNASLDIWHAAAPKRDRYSRAGG